MEPTSVNHSNRLNRNAALHEEIERLIRESRKRSEEFMKRRDKIMGKRSEKYEIPVATIIPIENKPKSSLIKRPDYKQDINVRTVSLDHALVVPNKYRCLKEKFQSMDKVVNSPNKEKLQTRFEKAETGYKKINSENKPKSILIKKPAYKKDTNFRTVSLDHALVVPNKYRCLQEKFQWLDKVVNSLNKEKLLTTFEVAQTGDKKINKKFWKSHLGQIKGSLPDVFSVLYISSSDKQSDNSYTLVINPNISVDARSFKCKVKGKLLSATTAWTLHNWKPVQHSTLTNIVKNYHRVFFAHESEKLIKNPTRLQNERNEVVLKKQLKILHVLCCLFKEDKALCPLHAAVDKIIQNFHGLMSQMEVISHFSFLRQKELLSFVKYSNDIFIVMNKRNRCIIRSLTLSNVINNL